MSDLLGGVCLLVGNVIECFKEHGRQTHCIAGIGSSDSRFAFPPFLCPQAAEKEAYLLRYHLARCLTFLVECDPAVTSRHRVRVRRLLEALLDDNCQSVRLQAARANNLWHLKV